VGGDRRTEGATMREGGYYACLYNVIWITLVNQVFNENQVIVMLKSAAGGRAGGRQLLVSAQ